MTPVKNNLVALGTAAVVAVYSAGYARTREAAERFAVEDSQRRHEHERHVQAAPVIAEIARHTIAHADTVAHATANMHAPASQKHSEANSEAQPRTTASAHADSTHLVVADTTAKPDQPTPRVIAPSPTAPPASPVPVPPSSVAVPPSTTTTFKVTPPASADTSTADKPLKDGVYSGWGTSRHGDIEATVAIKNGKIAEAFISQCLTQYSCSWVAALPPQVVARQSAEVDYVSGATQSTNAFYYAVIAALKKAK